MVTNGCEIIAECGSNHLGDIDAAKKMIDAAKEAGADTVKFQCYKTELLMNLPPGAFEITKRAELGVKKLKELIEYCDGINFLCSAFDTDSLWTLYSLGLKRLKVPSGQLTSGSYLSEAGKLFHTIILSTGMATDIETNSAVLMLAGFDNELSILHCTSKYPTPFEDVNLNTMLAMLNVYPYPVGLSDHTLGIEVSVAAVALGARIIEKHFTLDKTLDTPDRAVSLNPKEFTRMVKSIRNTEKAMGGFEKCIAPLVDISRKDYR